MVKSQFLSALVICGLKHLMEDENINQKQLAESIRVTEATVSRWLSGERTPNLQHIVMIMSVYNCNFDYLICGHKE